MKVSNLGNSVVSDDQKITDRSEPSLSEPSGDRSINCAQECKSVAPLRVSA